MSKSMTLLLVLCLGGVTQAFAQELNAVSGESDVSLPAPPYCQPCIFYSGDFDPNPQAEPNGLLNGLFPGNIDGEVWVPFTVGKKIVISGLFINELFSSPPPATAPVRWAIRAKISAGDGGTEQCRGNGFARATPTGRTFAFMGTTYTEWTYLLRLPSPLECMLERVGSSSQPGREAGLPDQKGQCPPNCYVMIQPDNETVGSEPAVNSGFLSDIPSNAQNHFGLPNVLNNSFFTSKSFGFNFVPATTACKNGPPLAITKVGCHMFSVGLIGWGQ